MSNAIVDTAQKTIALEARAIHGLAAFVGPSFAEAVQAIHQSNGRVVVSGIGKSALIGQKIVATLNSTGTPALFMHAGDAIHGDLGMIQREDVVLLISKSGESPEIKILVPLVKGFGNRLIAMVGNVDGYLARQADFVLNTTVEQEACPHNLAPTSSTTAQMVMGDALAVCLMQLTGFTGKDFARFHPGGNLGKKLYLRVEDLYVHNAKPSVNATASLKEVIIVISKSRLGATAVTDEAGNIAGIITDGDVRRMLEHTDQLGTIQANDLLHRHPITIEPQQLAVEALDVLRQHNISQLVVTNGHYHYLGMLHLHDLLREGLL